ncbi:MAG: OB-fold domain-containing protein [Bacillota bacterium]
MVGITAYGAYIPYTRLDRKRFAEAFGGAAQPGEKAVANHDEDSVSMAASAAIDCMTGLDKNKVNALYFATTTSPYREKQSATTIAAALDLDQTARTTDFTDTLRSSSAAILAALDAVNSWADTAVIAVGDSRLGASQGQFEQVLGDGAAALAIGKENVIAEVVETYSIAKEFIDNWRAAGDTFIRAWEERFIVTEGYDRTVKEATAGLLAKAGVTPKDITRLVLYGPTPRYQASAAAAMGFGKDQIQDTLANTVGNAGAANAAMMLVAALEEAKPGDTILFVTYGDGADAILFKVTDAITQLLPRKGIKGNLNPRRNDINVETYLKWKNMVPIEAARRPEKQRPSVPAMWRGYKQNLGFYGSKCTVCGTAQFPIQRVCVKCQAKDQMEPYRFGDKQGTISTFTIDHLSASPDPPTLFAAIDFDGGGRIIFEVTDCDPAELHVGMRVEPCFRRLYEAGGISNYFWKSRPVRS